MDRETAKATGLKRYSTGLPCIKGHLSERYVSSGNCIECINPISKSISLEAPEMTIIGVNFTLAKAEAESRLKSAQDAFKAEITNAELIRANAIKEFLNDKSSEHGNLVHSLLDRKQAAKAAQALEKQEAKDRVATNRLEREKAIARLTGIGVSLPARAILKFDEMVFEKTQSKCPQLKFKDIVIGNKDSLSAPRQYRVFYDDVEEIEKLGASAREVKASFNEMTDDHDTPPRDWRNEDLS